LFEINIQIYLITAHHRTVLEKLAINTKDAVTDLRNVDSNRKYSILESKGIQGFKELTNDDVKKNTKNMQGERIGSSNTVIFPTILNDVNEHHPAKRSVTPIVSSDRHKDGWI